MTECAVRCAVRVAKVVDLDRVRALALQSQELHYIQMPDRFRKPHESLPSEYFAERLIDPKSTLIVADVRDQVEGFALASLVQEPDLETFQPRSVLIVEELVVAQGLRGSGVGRELVRQIVEMAVEQRLDGVEVIVWEFNQSAINFYQRLGFQGASRRLELPVGVSKTGLPKPSK